MIPSLLLATSAFDLVDPAFGKLALISFAVSGLSVLIAGGLKLFAEQKYRMGIFVACIGLVLAFVQFAFAWQVRHIDFQPTAGDSTPASPSLLKALFGLVLIAVACWIYGRWCLPHLQLRTRRVGGTFALLAAAAALTLGWPSAEAIAAAQEVPHSSQLGGMSWQPGSMYWRLGVWQHHTTCCGRWCCCVGLCACGREAGCVA